jgi:hypothetical protein
VRVLENYRRYAEIASRAVRYQLVELEGSWQDLVPVRAGWTARLDAIAAALEPAALSDRAVRSAWLFGTDGIVLRSSPGGAASISRGDPLPEPADALMLQEFVARADSAEYDRGDSRAAMEIYAALATRVGNPRLRAIALSERGRTALQAGDTEAGIAAAREVLSRHATALDLENQPLRLVAKQQLARALELRAEPAAAAQAILDLEADLDATSPELAPSQYRFFHEWLDEAMGRLASALPPESRGELVSRRAALAGRSKSPPGEVFFARKLSRKLVRAVMDEQPYSTGWRYVSDVAEGRPYLLAYTFLPDAAGARLGGLLGLIVDLEHLSTTVLPSFLHELELSEEAWLEIIDEAGNRIIGETPTAAGPAVVESNLGEPF